MAEGVDSDVYMLMADGCESEIYPRQEECEIKEGRYRYYKDIIPPSL